jgi:HEAT repeat protein
LSHSFNVAALASAWLLAGASWGFAQNLGHPAVQKTATSKSLTSSKETGLKTQASDCCQAKSLSAAAWDVLAGEIRSDGESHRAAAVSALALVGNREDTLPLLEGALDDKRPTIRKDAALALGDMRANSAAPKLRVLLDDSSPDVGFAAANALWKMDDHSGRQILIATLGGQRRGDGFVKSSMKDTYREYTNPKQLAMMGAREAAGAVFGPASIGINVAQEYMKDRGASSRAASATLLGKDGSPDSIHLLTLALCDKSWAVRAAAAQALVKSPGHVAPEVLEPLLIDDSITVRDMAAAGIIRLSHAPAPKDLRWPAPPPTREAKR